MCLVAGSVGQFAQYVVTPVRQADSATEHVASAAAHLTLLRASTWLDLLILLTIPATVYAGMVAGGVRSRLATLGTGLGVLTSLGYYLATDVLVQIAATGGDRSAATRTYGAYLQAEPVSTVFVAYLLGSTLGFVLLGIALLKARTVPAWAAVAVVLFPFVKKRLVTHHSVSLGAGNAHVEQ